MDPGPSPPSPRTGDGRPPLRVLAVGASAGGVEALRRLLHELPGDLPAAVLVVLHLAAHTTSALPQVLARTSTLPVSLATNGARLEPGRVYVCAPDHHLLVRDGAVRLGSGPQENGHRPAVDPLFRSAARWLGPRVVALVLSGALDDGAAGALAVAEQGGIVIVQDPAEALYPGMPSATLRAVPGARSAPLARLPALVEELIRAPAGPDGAQDDPPGDPSELAVETDMAELGAEALQRRPGTPSPLACPDCHGVLFEVDDEPVLRFRCRVGHAWSAESLVVEQQEQVEEALWVALRAVEERAALHERLRDRAQEAGHEHLAGLSAERAAEARRSAGTLREVLLRQASGLTGQVPG